MLGRHLKILAASERQVRNEIDLAGPEGLDAMKVVNIRPQKIDSHYTTRSTWLAQKALSGMKVVIPDPS